jgi:hypothetical protein
MKPVNTNQRGCPSLRIASSLQKMFDLRQIGVRIAVVHQLIQKLRRLPDALLAFVQTEVLFLAIT